MNYFLTKKLENQQLYLMKTLGLPSNRENEQLMREIAQMRSIHNDCVLQCTDAYFYKGRIWLF